MSTLIVSLPSGLPTAATPCSAVVSEDGRTIQRHVETTAALLPNAPNLETVAVVPASQLSWHRLELPKGTLDRSFFQEGNGSRLRSVLNGLLEDRILDEPEHMHFAIQPEARAGTPIWVAACNRTWLDAWLLALEQAGRPVARIVPEMEPPTADAPAAFALHVLGTPDSPLCVWSGPQGVTVLPLSSTSVALMTVALTNGEIPEVTAEPGVAELAEHHFKGRVALQTQPQRALVSAQSAWDLAQFDLLRSSRARTRKRLSTLGTSLLQSPKWKPARWAAAALVVINLAGLQAWAWKEQSALAAKRSAIREILTTTFPDVRVVVDAPLQMARSLADLQRQSGAASSGDMETMLGLFQTVAPEIPAPTAIEFIAGELRLKVPDPSAVALPPLSTRLQAHGYSATVDSDRLVLKQERRP